MHIVCKFKAYWNVEQTIVHQQSVKNLEGKKIIFI